MILLITRSDRRNGNYFTFKHFYNCIEYCQNIIKSLITILQQRKHYIDIADLQILNSQLVKINKELTFHGKEGIVDKKSDDFEFIDYI